MKTQVTFSQFTDGFQCRPDNFSYAGLAAMYEWFNELEEDIGTEITFDPIGICCEFSEFESLADFQSDYGDDYETIDDIEQATSVIRFDYSMGDDSAFIIQQF